MQIANPQIAKFLEGSQIYTKITLANLRICELGNFFADRPPMQHYEFLFPLTYLKMFSPTCEIYSAHMTFVKPNSQWWARAMNSSFYLRVLIFLKQIKVSLYLEPFLSTEHSFLKHLVQLNMSQAFKCQRDFHFFPENQRFKNKMIDFAHPCRFHPKFLFFSKQ
jgi:hypothetical protein